MPPNYKLEDTKLKQQNSQTTILLDNYIITLQKLKSSKRRPRYRAYITNFTGLCTDGTGQAMVYDFTGIYRGNTKSILKIAKIEAEYILNYHKKLYGIG